MITATTTVAAKTDNPVQVFADFEKGFGGWHADGNAFGTEPKAGNEAGRDANRPFAGRFIVSSDPEEGNGNGTGTLTSPEFTIRHMLMTFFIGGGATEATALQLLIEGEVVASASGYNSLSMREASIDLSAWRGKKARIRLVDQADSGTFGFVGADHIVFMDQTPSETVGQAFEKVRDFDEIIYVERGWPGMGTGMPTWAIL